jgi:cysteine-rich repeat protein
MLIKKYTYVISFAVIFMLSGISIANAQPDLVITSFSASTSEVELGVPFTATATLANQGTSAVEIPDNGGTVYFGIFLSTDDSYDSSDICAGFGGVFYQLLTPGSSRTSGPVNMQVNPEDAPPGTYNLIAKADAICHLAGHVAESDETNNTLTGDLITMLPSTAVVDLTITDLIGTNRVVLGDRLRLDTFITNLGPDTAPGRSPHSCGHLTGFYLSTDDNITTSDTLIGSICLNDLAGETTYRFWMDVHIPVNIPAGQYYWGAISDYTDVLVETDETNNTFATSKRVRVSAGVCGDGTVNQMSEECDDGNTVNGDGCENDCTFTPTGGFCGDGLPDAGEECDDGNTVDGDGCENDCTFTPVGSDEICDDGIDNDGDGKIDCADKGDCKKDPVCR